MLVILCDFTKPDKWRFIGALMKRNPKKLFDLSCRSHARPTWRQPEI